jgi:hypothetical protein
LEIFFYPYIAIIKLQMQETRLDQNMSFLPAVNEIRHIIYNTTGKRITSKQRTLPCKWRFVTKFSTTILNAVVQIRSYWCRKLNASPSKIFSTEKGFPLKLSKL